jgi:hypothetical protein
MGEGMMSTSSIGNYLPPSTDCVTLKRSLNELVKAKGRAQEVEDKLFG